MQWGGGATGRGSIFKRTAQASAASDAGAAPGYHGTMLRTLCLLVLLLASSCFAATFYVNVTASAFVPQSLSIQEGDIVVWSWNNGAGWYAPAFARTHRCVINPPLTSPATTSLKRAPPHILHHAPALLLRCFAPRTPPSPRAAQSHLLPMCVLSRMTSRFASLLLIAHLVP